LEELEEKLQKQLSKEEEYKLQITQQEETEKGFK
jgi:chromosome segregation ATPase